MLRNYLKTALRFLGRNKLFAAINLLGLSIAFAVTFIILLYVINELSYNSGFENRKQIYRVLNDYENLKIKSRSDEAPYVLSKSIKDEFPQVNDVAPVSRVEDFSIKLDDELIGANRVVGTNSGFFQIFPILVAGQTGNILADPNAIVLSQTQAQKFFPDEDPMGKELTAMVGEEEAVFVVKGVFKDFPVNSSLQADFFVSSKWPLEQLNQRIQDENAKTDWHSSFWEIWLLVDQKADLASFDQQFRDLEKKAYGDKDWTDFSLQNLSDVYLGSEGIQSNLLQGNRKQIRIFSAIAILIILLAAFNYIILSTAVSTGRAKEIGIRKTNGASVHAIRSQLLNESVMLALVVLPIALFFGWLGKPFAENLFQAKLMIIPSNRISYVSVYVALTLFVGLLSGLYSSSFLSRLNVIRVLSNPLQTGRRKSGLRFALIVVQLVIFCAFVSSALIMRSQYQYVLGKKKGYFNHDILFVDMGNSSAKAFISNIKAYPDVIAAGGAVNALPMESAWPYNMEHFQDKTKKVSVELLAVDYDFVETMGIQLLEGRNFSHQEAGDEQTAYLLNETAVKALGIIGDPVGKHIDTDNGTIIGVVKDFNLHSLHSEIPPLVMIASDAFVRQVAIHYKAGTLGSLLPLIKTEWDKVADGEPFSFKTIEDLSQQMYADDQNLSVIVSLAALFSLLIASLGLFGITLYVVKAQTKEIGVKKVFGSSERGIVLSLLSRNMMPLTLASVLSIPITVYVMETWLSNFAFRTNIGWGIFVSTFLLAAFVVLITVFYHSYRASRINPVEALRYE